MDDMVKRKQMMKTGRIASCKRRKRTTKLPPHIPKEIIFNILSWLSAGFLHDIGKYVCKTWADIIRDPLFIETHLLHSNSGIFIEDGYIPHKARFLEAKEGKLKMTHLKRLFSAEILASCEGVSLFLTGDLPHPMLHVENCVTMKVLKLPCLPSPIHVPPFLFRCHIARIPHTGAFKVISPFKDSDGFYHWHVLTVGTDMSWRKIYGGFTEEEFHSYMQIMISICGVLYFANESWMRNGSSILAVDLRDESIHYIRIPKEYLIMGKYHPKAYGLLQMGNHLSFLVFEKNETQVNICILKDIYSSEWVTFHKIEVNVDCKIWNRMYKPFAWLDNGRTLIFGDRKLLKSGELRMRLVAYNVKTGVMTNIKNVETIKFHYVLVHTNSLVSW